ncbi:hypothetical protein EYC80_007207 [Monilinia laxa]|uniref:Uncharacterized protein n=1 Tax=Monilinia laxa TaxID=61186 RepID=A0A5N6K0M0_MONLA|nr:hypothetical protein EYC80_007207 [Monilinia laxa]
MHPSLPYSPHPSVYPHEHLHPHRSLPSKITNQSNQPMLLKKATDFGWVLGLNGRQMSTEQFYWYHFIAK